MKDSTKILISISVAAALWIGGCYHGESRWTVKNGGSDTAITKRKIVHVGIPIPVRVVEDSIVYVKEKTTDSFYVDVPLSDTVRIPYTVPDWMVNILNDYGKTRYYDTSVINGKDTVRFSNIVRRNKIDSQKINAVFYDSVITHKKIIYPPKKTVVSFLISGMGNYLLNRFGGGAGLQLKTPTDKTYSVQVKKVHNLPILFEGTVGIPIRLKIFPNLFKKDSL